MQINHYRNPYTQAPLGGGVIHGITGPFIGKCSAYFNERGELHDADQITSRSFRTRPVKRGGPIWRYLERIVKVHAA